MKLSLFFVLCFSTVAVGSGYSQGSISVKMESGRLSDALDRIMSISQAKILFDIAETSAVRSEAVDIRNKSVADALTEVLKGTGFGFVVVEDVYVVKAVGEKTAQQPAEITVKGKVTDANGNPLVGVSVILKGTQRGVTTDAGGNFSLTVTGSDPVTLQMSYIGKKNVERTYSGSGEMNVVMEDSSTAIDDVVVTGYSTISKERAAGSFNRIGSDVIDSRHAVDLSTALLGTVAGMKGIENADGTIEYSIRGVNSLMGERKPLVVVDGFPVANGFADINPNDVKDITILKDAAAASIWGARSANGVIVVTTKSATGGQRKGVNVEVNAMVRVGRKIDLDNAITHASSADQVAWERLYYERGWKNPYSFSFDNILWGGSLSLATELLEEYYFGAGGMTEADLNRGLDELAGRNNRKQIKDFLLNNPILQQYNMSLTSSTDKSQNYLSALYETEKGNVIRNGADRFRINYNNKSSIFKWLDFTLSSNLHYVKRNTSGPSMEEIAGLSPYEMILNDDGSYATQLNSINRTIRATIPEGQLPYDDWTYNILREVRGRNYTEESLNARIQGTLNFKLLEGLDFSSSFQYELNKNNNRQVDTEETFYVRNIVNSYIEYDQNTQTKTAEFIPKGGFLRASDSNMHNYMWRNQLSFNRSFGENRHVVSALAGVEIRKDKTEGTAHPWVFGYDENTNSSAQLPYGGYSTYKGDSYIELTDIIGSYIFSLADIGANVLLPEFTYRDDRYVSVYFNASYSFDNRYSITGSVRSDASNLITDDAAYRWSPFWSVGGLWNLSNENFMENSRGWLDRLALTLTYGYTGNVDKSTSHKTLISMSSSPSVDFGNAYTGSISSFGNPYLRWEKTGTLNFGIDYSFLSGMFSGSIDIYNKQSKDVIGLITLASFMGTKTQKMNSAEVMNRGVEVEFGFRKTFNSLRIESQLTYAYNKNKITRLFKPNTNVVQLLTGGAIAGSNYVEGNPVGGLMAYQYAGVVDGIPQVIGLGGDPTSFDTYLGGVPGLEILKYCGPGTAPHDLGWRTSLSAYGFNLSFYVTGQFGGFFRKPVFGYNMVENGKNIINRYVTDVMNASGNMPGMPQDPYGEISEWGDIYAYSDIAVESSSFVKLKEINLEYNIPGKITSAIGLSRAKVYTQIRNLGCIWTKNSRHSDPEWLPGTVKPVTTFLFGINLNF